MVAVTGMIDYLVFRWVFDGFNPLMMVPVLLLLADESFVVGRTGMLIHYHTRHTQEGLREFLMGNGAKQFEALLPYYRRVIGRSLLLSAWRWLLIMLIMLFALCFVLLFGGLSFVQALWLLLGIMLSVICCSVLSLLCSAFLYDRLNR
jgi:hypothetical protein